MAEFDAFGWINGKLTPLEVVMTTDPEEGRRQIEAMQPEPLKVGDKVRLAAGGERVMTVVGFFDYDNMVQCDPPGDSFPARSLVRVE